MADDHSFWRDTKEMFNNNTECYMCRAISSFALFASGAFLYQQRNNFGRVNSYVQTALASGLIVMSFARAVALPPFEEHSSEFRRRTPEKK